MCIPRCVVTQRKPTFTQFWVIYSGLGSTAVDLIYGLSTNLTQISDRFSKQLLSIGFCGQDTMCVLCGRQLSTDMTFCGINNSSDSLLTVQQCLVLLCQSHICRRNEAADDTPVKYSQLHSKLTPLDRTEKVVLLMGTTI